MPVRFCARLVTALVFASSLIGCGYGYHQRGVHVHSSGNAAAVGLGVVAGAAILAASAHEERPREQPIIVYNTYYVNGPVPEPPVTPPSSKDRIPTKDELPSFDPSVARAALNGIDVSACRESGAPRGYGHAKVVWNPDGSISKVVVDEPANLSPAAAKCVGDRLGTAAVPPFRGSLVTVGATWYVP